MGTRSQKRTVGASLWIIFKATKTRFGMRKSALQAGHLTSSLPSSNFSKRFASGVIVIWVWQPLHGTSIEPAQRSAPVKLISFLSSGIATPICYPSPDRSGTIPAQQRANARLVVPPKAYIGLGIQTSAAIVHSKFKVSGFLATRGFIAIIFGVRLWRNLEGSWRKNAIKYKQITNPDSSRHGRQKARSQ